MTIKLHDLSRWYSLPANGSIAFKGEGSRLIRLKLNCEAETSLWIKWAGVPPLFLATVPAGLETVEFYADGSFEIAPSEADGPAIQWQTAESEPVAVEDSGESFTSIHEREPRNEALEYVIYQSELNAKRREESLRAEFAAQLQAMRESDGGATGIHGGAAAQYQEPVQPVASKAKRPASAGGDAGPPAVDGELDPVEVQGEAAE